jgi:hypothetical protein
MGHYVTIEQGDYLATLAAEAGFPDWQPIWDAAENQSLKDKGRSPDCLLPGDQVFVPDRTPKDTKVTPGTRYQATVTRGQLTLRLALRDFMGNPRKGAACKVTVDGNTRDLTAGDDGVVEVPIQPGATSGELVVGDDTFELAIGHLDPISERTGAIARLRNLGYLTDTPDDGMNDVDRDALRFAVELFQARNQLPIAGNDLDSILDALVEAHGS